MPVPECFGRRVISSGVGLSVVLQLAGSHNHGRQKNKKHRVVFMIHHSNQIPEEKWLWYPHAGLGDPSGKKDGFSHRKFEDRSHLNVVWNCPPSHSFFTPTRVAALSCMAFWREATVFSVQFTTDGSSNFALQPLSSQRYGEASSCSWGAHSSTTERCQGSFTVFLLLAARRR